MCGKGDTPRPVDREKYDANYERIFGTEKQVKARRRKLIARQKAEKERAGFGVTFKALGVPDHRFLDEVIRLRKELKWPSWL